MLSVPQQIRVSLSIGDLVAIFKLTTIEVLRPRAYGFQRHLRGRYGEAAHVYFVRGITSGDSDSVDEGNFHVRQANVTLVDSHRQHLSHGVFCQVDATVAARMVGARRCLMLTMQLVWQAKAWSMPEGRCRVGG